uniref:Uncharacterized protein n=1 Tax=Chaetoceros debilis TaxID=122233 RepID=A0A7S3Q3U5_9STRA|mmetsp:Transcript_654/g.806  ORF Transcript_654/g.806 Transcript_654/m.806 type:complete len:141 (-) Transcript_654:145-567(-)
MNSFQPPVCVITCKTKSQDCDQAKPITTLSGHTYYYIEGPEKGFKTREEAVNRARKFRRGECMFEGWDELYKRPAGSDDDGDKDDEEDEKEDIIDESELPWCSTDLDHIDHDEDQVIHVVLLSDYSNEEIERRNNILRRA